MGQLRTTSLEILGIMRFPTTPLDSANLGRLLVQVWETGWVVIQGFGFETFSVLQTVTSCVLLNPQSFSSLDTKSHSVFM